MTTIPADLGAVTLFVADIARAKVFYSRVFGLAPIYEDDVAAAFRFQNVVINLLERRAAPELVAPSAIAEPGAGTGALLTIWVDDSAAAIAELEARGVELLNGPIDRPWGQRTAAFADPDGHVWEVAQTIPATKTA